MEKLEEHIRKNREDLDRYSPSSDIWKRIRKSLKKEKSYMKRWLSVAAMIVVILGTAIIFFKPEHRWSDSNRGKNNNEVFSQVNPQLKETDRKSVV